MASIFDNMSVDDCWLGHWFNACYLDMLKTALQLAGIRSRYEPPGSGDIFFARLTLKNSNPDEADRVICVAAVTYDRAPDERWFMWWGDTPQLICQAIDMTKAARLIAEELS